MSWSELDEALLRSAAVDDRAAAARREANRAVVMRAAGVAATSTVTAKSVGKLAVLKKLLAALGIGVVVAGAVVVVRAGQRGGDERRPEPAVSAVSAPPPVPTASDERPSALASAAVSSAASGNVAPTSAPARPRASGSSEDPLTAETRLLEAARTCIDGGDVPCAVARLEEHRRRFPHGVLGDEAKLMRIDVARRRSDDELARHLAKELLDSSPSGPYARRARNVLDELARDAAP